MFVFLHLTYFSLASHPQGLSTSLQMVGFPSFSWLNSIPLRGQQFFMLGAVCAPWECLWLPWLSPTNARNAPTSCGHQRYPQMLRSVPWGRHRHPRESPVPTGHVNSTSGSKAVVRAGSSSGEGLHGNLGLTPHPRQVGDAEQRAFILDSASRASLPSPDGAAQPPHVNVTYTRGPHSS